MKNRYMKDMCMEKKVREKEDGDNHHSYDLAK